MHNKHSSFHGLIVWGIILMCSLQEKWDANILLPFPTPVYILVAKIKLHAKIRDLHVCIQQMQVSLFVYFDVGFGR